MYLLDTNICICFMKNTYPQLTQRLLSHSPSELLISSLTVLELEYGAKKATGAVKQGKKWPYSSLINQRAGALHT